jgi:beta-galactosidase
VEPKFPKMYYGGDYNPDQWPEEVWAEDMRLFKLAGINIVTVPVFSWAKLQPSEDMYDFAWLDKVMNLAAENGIVVCLATSTAAQPAWMSKKYPDMLPVDFDGRRRKHGGRVNFCPNHGKYRELSAALAEKLAERYAKHPALAVWHIGNEYGCYCYCDTCAAEFRKWLQKRYKTIEKLNEVWNMSFWGHTVYEWDEIEVPSGISEMWRSPSGDRTTFQGIALDYNRFMSDSSLQCYRGEYDVIRKFSSGIPITTNLMGTFKPLDYFKWAEHMDIVSWDNYPSLDAHPGNTALRHDLMRGLKDGQPFMLMEQTPSQQNWQPYNSLKRPGVMRLWSYQAVAHGADTVMFFQLRRSIGACEKYHGAVIEHVGHEHTRVFRECAQLGAELEKLGDRLVGSRTQARAAILFDWENWWAVELSSGPTIQLKYVEQVEKYYRAFYDANIPVDIVRPDSDLTGYDIVIAPVLYMVKPGMASRLESFVEKGGTFITTFFSGIVNENDIVTLGGYPGELGRLLGIWVEEIDALLPHMKNSMVVEKVYRDITGTYECGILCDLLHLKGAEALARYGKDFYAGMPALTVNEFGMGRAYYIATDPEARFVRDFIHTVCADKGISAPFAAEPGIEITRRYKENKEYTFVLNHNDSEADVKLGDCRYTDLLNCVEIEGNIVVAAKEVVILERDK